MVGTTRSGRTLPEWKESSYGRAADLPGANGRFQNKRTKNRRATRAVTNRPSLNNETSADEVPAATNRIRLTRSQPIRCTHYGPDREALFPLHWFCGPCNIWDSMVSSASVGQSKRDSRRNECCAKHQNPAFPTQLKAGVVVSSQGTQIVVSDSSSSSDDEDEDGDEESVVLVEQGENETETLEEVIVEQVIARNEMDWETVDLRREVARLKSKLERTQSELINAKGTIRKLRSRSRRELRVLKPEQMSNAAYAGELADGFLSAFAGTRSKKKKKKLANELFSSLARDDRMEDLLVGFGKNYLRQNVFDPFSVLRLMDLEGGKLNYEAIGLLRQLETKGEKYQRNTLIPSVGELKKVAKLVESLGQIIAPYTAGVTENGAEKVEFAPEDVIKILLEAADLLGLDRKVILSQAMDGSRFSKQIGFILYGLKLNDYAAKCPWTKKPLFTVDAAGAFRSQLQSKNTQIILKIVIGKEDAAIYGEFKALMEQVAGFKGFRIGEEEDGRTADISIDTVCTDLSATWKGTGKGGACKVCSYFCSCCSTHSDNVQKANPVLCERWCQIQHGNKPGWSCFHKEFLTDEVVLRQESELENVLKETINGRLVEQDTWLPKCKVGRTDDPRIPTTLSLLDPTSIHFDVTEASQQDRASYSKLLNNDLKVRVLSIRGPLSERQKRLLEAMKEEKMVRLLQEAIAHGHRGRATALFTTLNNPPCILHMHNRIALKKLTVILKNGLSNALAGRLDGKLFSTGQLATLHESTKKRFDAFVKKVENLFNTEVWGTPFAPTHWNLPVDDREKKILTLCLDNERCKTAIDSFDRIIDFLLVPDNQPAAYKECVHTFRSVMVKVRQKTPFSDEDIASFQRTTDEWYQMWMTLEGREGCTNYTHLLGAGHVADMLFHHRNLYVFSNQGWEALNMLVKQVYFRRTARGGGRQASSRLLPIARWLQRRLVFMAVTDEADLKNKLEELLAATNPPAEPVEEQPAMEEEEEDDIFETMWL
jgi:hypothetical protein